MNSKSIRFVASVVLAACLSPAAFASGDTTYCNDVPGYNALKAALVQAVADETSGLNNHMWATLVDRDGNVCAVAYSGANRGAQWLGSRVISAQKANTGNAFSLDFSSARNGSGQAAGLAWATANLFSAVQPGGSLYGLQHSNPVDAIVAYDGRSANYGTSKDPLVGSKVGGVNVFGGGLGLYAVGHRLIGGVGVSGDTSCADHFIAWRVRNALGLDHMAATNHLPAVPGPASLFDADPDHPDNIILDITPNAAGGTGSSASGFGHPACLNTGDPLTLPAVQG